MKLVVIIPCLNEERTIADVIAAIPPERDMVDEIETIVVDDGSIDGTAECARSAGARVVSHPVNMGVGAAFQTGITCALRAGADVVVNMDGDGQFNPADIPQLLAPILKDEADFVTASRFLDPELEPDMPRVKKWGNHRIAQLVSVLVGQRFRDVSCGYRAYSREAAMRLTLFGSFTYTQETFLDLAFKGMRIKEIPVRVRGVREFGQSRVASNLWRYALNTSKIIFRTFRDYRPMTFFSAVAALFFFVAMAHGLFFVGHYLATGVFWPHKWAGMVAAFFAAMAVIALVTGLLADMLDRIRRNQEELLYLARCRSYGNRDARPTTPTTAR